MGISFENINGPELANEIGDFDYDCIAHILLLLGLSIDFTDSSFQEECRSRILHAHLICTKAANICRKYMDDEALSKHADGFTWISNQDFVDSILREGEEYSMNFLSSLSVKLHKDSIKDTEAGRSQLGGFLEDLSNSIARISIEMRGYIEQRDFRTQLLMINAQAACFDSLGIGDFGHPFNT